MRIFIIHMKSISIVLLLLSLYFFQVPVVRAQEKNNSLHGTLQEVVVSGSHAQKVLKSASAYVVDYDFVGEDVLLATFMAGSKRAYLFLMTGNSDTLAMVKLPEEPTRLYKSCVGKYYCVCTNQFYPITIEANTIRLERPYPIGLLQEMSSCEYAVKDKFYYRIRNKDHFDVRYGWEKMGDSTFHLIERFYLLAADRSSTAELIKILLLLEKFQFSAAAKLSGTRYLLNKASYASIDLPLYTSADSLVIFDLRKKHINFFDLEGQRLTKSDIRFEWKDPQRLGIVKDEVTGKFYLHRRDNATAQAVEELDINTGEVTGKKLPIVKPFAEKIKVHNGNIYYLWQDSHNAATMQLFVQR